MACHSSGAKERRENEISISSLLARRMKIFWVYILASRPRGMLFVGITSNRFSMEHRHRRRKDAYAGGDEERAVRVGRKKRAPRKRNNASIKQGDRPGPACRAAFHFVWEASDDEAVIGKLFEIA